MVAALIAWCIRSFWESSSVRGVWLSNLLLSVTRVLDHVCVVCKRIFARQENPTSLALGHISGVQPTLDREGTETVAV